MKNHYLIHAAIMSFSAALLHLGCIVFGANWYRMLGAGEQMAKMAELGSLTPTIITSCIILLLLTCSSYALSGAGVIKRLPFTRIVLALISMVFLLRGVAFPAMMPALPENSLLFWLVSSTICIVIGAFYAFGTWQIWSNQEQNNNQNAPHNVS